jgi:hypothetical protein
MNEVTPLGGKKSTGHISSADAAEIERLKCFGAELAACGPLPTGEVRAKAIREAYVKMYPKLKSTFESYEKEHLLGKEKR